MINVNYTNLFGFTLDIYRD
ncbi:hypothetical protein C370_07387 [Cryptococcus neoformans A1-35-8]|nr:hypothetical protein C370_07387 [Cryptococcus neoformans var. grubii A1-35-8]